MHQDTWQTQEAKAHFSEMLRAAQKKPQWITYRGERAGVLISEEEYEALHARKRKTQKKSQTVGEFFRNSSLYASGIDLDLSRPRVKNTRPDITFE